MGLFENPVPFKNYQYDLVGSDEFKNVSYQTAAEAITLLKNQDNILPLNVNDKILVTGPAANSYTLINGAWSRTWQGTDSQYDDTTELTIYKAIKTYSNSVVHSNSVSIDSMGDISQTLIKANNSEFIIACLAENPSTEIPGNINSLELEKAQLDYIKELSKLNKKLILVLVENRPRIINEIEEYCDAIIMAYQPSYSGTKALADIIFGVVNPSGKLPITYPRYVNSLITYDRKHTEEFNIDFSLTAYNPQFQFGYGLSYTNFEYSDLILSSDTICSNDTLFISVKISNTGDYDGKESVLLYINDDFASITPSVKKLRAFKKIELKKGESKTVNFNITKENISFINRESKRITEEGDFTIQISNIKQKFYFKE